MVQQIVPNPTLVQLQEFFVNPLQGNDAADGSPITPYKTLTRALQNTFTGTGIIRLSPGTYSIETGEIFPLIIPERVSLLAQSTMPNHPIVIQGGDDYDSLSFGQQNVALVLKEGAHVRGMTVTNPAARGTGIWLESNHAVVANCQIVNCGREGIFVTDTASPLILDCMLLNNRASGISFVRYARGEVRRCTLSGNTFGLVASDYAAPLILDSQIQRNRSGIVLSKATRPVLRRNRLEQNTDDGLAVYGQALPDLGQSQDPANNFFDRNGKVDLRNTTSQTITAAGNLLSPARVSGKVNLSITQLVNLTASTPAQWGKQPDASTRPATRSQPSIPVNKLTPVLSPSFTSTSTVATAHQCPDLAGHWAAPFIEALVGQRLLSTLPDGTFNPDGLLSRAEYATWIVRAFNLPAKQPSRDFQDVPSQHWAFASITQADRIGFITAFAESCFQPEAKLTRLQAILSLVQGLGLAEGTPDALSQYRDRVQIPSFALGAVAAATQKRLVVSGGEEYRLRPLEPITRAELAGMIYQSLGILGQTCAIASKYIADAGGDVASFVDVREHWAAPFICSLASQGGMRGTAEGKFYPDRLMTRAEYAVLLSQLFHPAPLRSTKQFQDVPIDHGAYQAIEQVSGSKLMSGFADGSFRPQQPVSRAQVLLSLVNQLDHEISPVAADVKILQRYRDQDAIPVAVRPAIATATAQWLVVNYPKLNYLRPQEFATRAEIAAMLYQALVRLGRATAIASPYIVHPRHPHQHRTFRQETVVVLDPGHGGTDVGAAGLGNIREIIIPSEPPVGKNPGQPLGGMMSPLPPQYGVPNPIPNPRDPMTVPPMPSSPPPGSPGGAVPPALDTTSSDMSALPLGMPIMREKDIVLSVALEAAELLRQQGVRVILTRSKDQDLALTQRVQMTQQVPADVFVSLHANADPMGQIEVNGVETYHYPQDASSTALAQSIHQTMLQTLDIQDRGVRAANFYVLRSLSIPAALVEIGYMTGQDDAANLANFSYRQKVAAAIVNGILQYVQAAIDS